MNPKLKNITAPIATITLAVGKVGFILASQGRKRLTIAKLSGLIRLTNEQGLDEFLKSIPVLKGDKK
jgi:hypothetical protein